MGYDIGYHAVSMEDIKGAFDFIFGKTDQIPYLDKALVASQSRFIANSWGLGITNYESNISNAAFMKADKLAQEQTPSFIGRLLGKKASKPVDPRIEMTEYLGGFDSDIHLWGRPFLITQKDKLNQLIDRYLQADSKESASIAKQQISPLKTDLLDNIVPDNAPMPDLETFKYNVEWKMQILKKCVQAFPAEVSDENGQVHSSVDILNLSLNFYILENVSLASATWMDRGLVWPSHLLTENGIRPSYLQSFSKTYPLREFLPDTVEIQQEETIEENWMVGAMVSFENLDQFREDINNPKIINKAKAENWGAHCRTAVAKITECIDYAKHRNLCFVESSDIYSGPMGVIT